MRPEEQVKSVKIFSRYKNYDIMNYRFKDVDDPSCYNITDFGKLIGQWPATRQGLGYGEAYRPGHMMWIVLEWTDGRDIKHVKEFPHVDALLIFFKEYPHVAKALGYVKKK